VDVDSLSDIDKAILKRLDDVSQQVKTNILKYEIGFASTLIYDFVYDDFCSWYLEFSKLNLHGDDQQKKIQTIAVLYQVLKAILVMLHPFAPFITEAIYEHLPQALPSLYMELYPQTIKVELGDDDYGFLVNMIRDIRAYKVRLQLAPNAKLNLRLQTSRPTFLKTYGVYLERFSFSPITEIDANAEPPQGETFVYHQGSLTIAMIVDQATLKANLQTQETLEISEIQRGEAMLKNENFLKKAPEKKIQEEQAKLTLHREKLKDIQDKLSKLL
jgi:valyl-tRNA synthetase